MRRSRLGGAGLALAALLAGCPQYEEAGNARVPARESSSSVDPTRPTTRRERIETLRSNRASAGVHGEENTLDDRSGLIRPRAADQR